jgi:hypothetical protein
MLMTAQVPVRSLAAKGASLKSRTKDLSIVDRSGFEAACEFGLIAKSIQADADGTALDELKALGNSVHKEITGLLAKLVKEPKAAEEFVKGLLVQFCRTEAEEHRLLELERHAAAVKAAKARRERELAALREADRHEEADRLAAIPVAVPFVPRPFESDPLPGVSISLSGFKVVVVDETLVPDDFKRQTTVVDTAAIEAVAAATGFNTRFPGVEFEPEYRVAISAR